MNLLKNILKRIKKNNKNSSEIEFYKKLFIENDSWNKPHPNEEEFLRWEIIENFVYEININDAIQFSILDVGCGRGWLTNLLSKHSKLIHGIDPVKPVIEHAKRMFPSIRFSDCTLKKLIKNNNKYDLIVLSEVIEHIIDEEKEDFINDIKSLLKISGFLILTTPRKEAYEEWSKYAFGDQPIEDWISELELEKLMVNHSFDTIKKKRLSISPIKGVSEIEIYQLWLFQNKII